MWKNEGREYRIWYPEAVSLKRNTLDSINGGYPEKNGTKDESSCTIKLNVVDTEEQR